MSDKNFMNGKDVNKDTNKDMRKERKMYDAITGLPDRIVDEAGNDRIADKTDDVRNIDAAYRTGAADKAGYDGISNKEGNEGTINVTDGKSGNAPKTASKTYRRIIAWTGAAAACIAAAFIGISVLRGMGIGSGMGDGNKGSSASAKAQYNNMLLLDVQYPQAHEFNDYEAYIGYNYKLDDAVKGFFYNTASVLLSDAKGNINYSPISLYYALAMAAEGAGGATKEQIMKLLGSNDTASLGTLCHDMYNYMNKDNKIGQLKINNSIWIDKKLNVNQKYVERLAVNYYAESFAADFSDNNTIKAMEKWISDKTGGLDAKLTPLDRQVLALVNTVYYYDEWLDKFNKKKTKEDVFHVDKDTDVRCDFMNERMPIHSFGVGEGYTISSLSLKNGGSMMFVLPDADVDVHELVSSPERIAEILEGGEWGCGEVIWKIPKFSFGSELMLKDVLVKLGVTDAFSYEDADFSGIGTPNAEVGDNIFIGGVRQDTHIAIDENGVEAKAFTVMYLAGSPMPDGRADMILDRPFLYAIKDNKGAVLFIGICENPVSGK